MKVAVNPKLEYNLKCAKYLVKKKRIRLYKELFPHFHYYS